MIFVSGHISNGTVYWLLPRWVLHIELVYIWQSTRDFFNSVFFTAIAGSLAGAYGGQTYCRKGKKREELLTEIRNTNAAIMIAFAVCNSFLSIKKQHVGSLKQSYDSQKTSYFDHIKLSKSGQINSHFKFIADFQSLFLPPFPLDILRQQIFEKLSVSNRPLMLVTTLAETVHGLNTSIDNRNRLIENYKNSAISGYQLLPLYFGLHQHDTHVINQEYPALVDAIYIGKRMMVFFSKLLCVDLVDHGKWLAQKFKSAFWKKCAHEYK